MVKFLEQQKVEKEFEKKCGRYSHCWCFARKCFSRQGFSTFLCVLSDDGCRPIHLTIHPRFRAPSAGRSRIFSAGFVSSAALQCCAIMIRGCSNRSRKLFGKLFWVFFPEDSELANFWVITNDASLAKPVSAPRNLAFVLGKCQRLIPVS